MGPNLATLHELEAEFELKANGKKLIPEDAGVHRAFLYATKPDTVTYYCFSDGKRVNSVKGAEDHLRALIAKLDRGERLWW